MNTVIYLALTLLLLYVIFFIFWPTGYKNEIKSPMSLAEAAPVTLTPIIKPGSTVYSISFWCRVDSWSSGNKTIIKGYDSDAASPTFEITFGDASTVKPILSINFKTSAAATETVTVTENFPLQSEVFVVLVVNSMEVDVYLNGKLLAAGKLTSPVSGNSSSIAFGSNFNCTISTFKREAEKNYAPDEVYALYRAGNPRAGNTITNYGATVQITKNGEDSTKIPIL